MGKDKLQQSREIPVRREIITWRELLSQTADRPHYDLDPPPDEDEPVVLHLFGTDEDLLSMVLTRDDYLDYLAAISRNFEFMLPTSVHEALASTTLLFLGYRLEDLNFQVDYPGPDPGRGSPGCGKNRRPGQQRG